MFKQIFCLFCLLFSMFCVANTFETEKARLREKEMIQIVSQMNFSETVASVINPSKKVLITNQSREKWQEK